MPSWRWRRCPRCREVRRASDYPVLEYRASSWAYGTIRRACPNCGYEAATYLFPIVREHHPTATGGAP